MKKIIKLILCTCALIISSCDNSTEPSLVDDTNDIYEVVLRDKFHNNGSGGYNTGDKIDSTYTVYFIGIYNEISSNYDFIGEPIDPNTNFLNRFDGFHKAIRKISNHIFLTNGDIRDKSSNEKGLIFKVGPIKWISDYEAEVEAGYWESFASADCYTYRLYKENGRWYIFYKTRRWIS